MLSIIAYAGMRRHIGRTTMLSSYILTRNSERHLEAVLRQIERLADDIVLLDSGSTDATLEIAARYPVRIFHREFDDFIRQREYAASLCAHDWILFVDSDEIPDDPLVEELLAMKKAGLGSDGRDSYRIRRDWYVLGQPVHSIYPIKSPDFRIRLYDRQGHFDSNNPVHEKLIGLRSTGEVKRGSLHHHTFEDPGEFERKLRFYAPLAAEAHRRRGKASGLPRAWLHAIAAWLKSFVSYQGWRDGRVGVICANYAFRYTLQKYLNSRR